MCHSNVNFGILNWFCYKSDVDANKSRNIVETVQMRKILKVSQHIGEILHRYFGVNKGGLR